MIATYTAASTTLHWSAGAAAPSLQSFQKMAVEEDLRGDEQDSPVFSFSWQVFNDTFDYIGIKAAWSKNKDISPHS